MEGIPRTSRVAKDVEDVGVRKYGFKDTQGFPRTTPVLTGVGDLHNMFQWKNGTCM